MTSRLEQIRARVKNVGCDIGYQEFHEDAYKDVLYLLRRVEALTKACDLALIVFETDHDHDSPDFADECEECQSVALLRAALDETGLDSPQSSQETS